MPHKDDKFRLSDDNYGIESLRLQLKGCQSLFHREEDKCMELRAEVTRLTQELEKATNVAIMYREQINQYQQDETWFQQRGSGVMK